MMWNIGGFDIELDNEDYERLKNYNYCVNRPIAKNHYLHYFIRGVYKDGKRTGTQLHRDIMGCVPGDRKIVDHINGNTLDCRKTNLRFCSRTGNNKNARLRKDNKSGVKGVYWSKTENKWKAQIRSDGKVFCLGTFDDIEEAALAYHHASEEYHREFRRRK